MVCKILYLGSADGTSGQRVAALNRLGHDITSINPYDALPDHRFARAWSYKTGAMGFENRVNKNVKNLIGNKIFDLTIVDNGELVSIDLVKFIRKVSGKVVLFNQDNPFSPRDGHRWRLLLQALPEYDLYVTPRLSNVEEAYRKAAKRVLRVWFGADEVVHRPPLMTAADIAIYGCDVAFVGTWMPERGPFLSSLIDAGVPLRIYGQRWNKDPNFSKIAQYVCEGDLVGIEYTKAIAGAKVNIALLSKGNYDLHTTRSMEIPAIGGLLCGERTREHSMLYIEGTEAEFWGDVDECIDKCMKLLNNEELRNRMSKAGKSRCMKNNHFNQVLLGTIIHEALGS